MYGTSEIHNPQVINQTTPQPPLGAGDEKDAGGEVINIPDATSELWFVQGRKDPFHQAPDLDALPPGDLAKAAAHWCVSLVVLAPFGG